MTATTATARPYDPIDLSSRAFWSTSAQERESFFAVLRAERPVSWHPPVEDALMTDPDDPGYWALTRRADLYTGYSITKDVGDGRSSAVPAGVTNPVTALLTSVQTFPLSYQSPVARLSIRVSPKIRWNAGWQFYNYHEQFGVLVPLQNYHAITGYSSILWSF